MDELNSQAYGPANSQRPGNIDPFVAFDNQLRYKDMLQYQMISQYAQSSISPNNLTNHQQREVARGGYQYGVSDDSAMRYYQRQQSLRNTGMAGGMVSGGATFGIPMAVELGALATKMRFLPSLALSSLAAIPAHFIGAGVDRSIERQKMMHSMAIDFDQYRGSMGMNIPMSYTETNSLAARMMGNVSSKGMGGNFFDRDQQIRIQKIGLSNGLLNARGSGADSGTMKQYEKNFNELKKTTEDVVKLLQTTIEGGMGVIKNLQQGGFKSMGAIRSQVMQAKAFGGVAGIGAENMMMIGQAGAQSVQGTPFAASIGANMYQQGAVQAAMMAGGSRSGAYAVERAGGVAGVGSAIARFQMNLYSSGIGTKTAAYMMNPDGSVNTERMNRVVSGKASGYEITTGAGTTGYAMGANKVMFEKYKEDFYNNPNIKGWQRDAITMGDFKAWGNRFQYASQDAKAWKFAGMYTNDIREQRAVSEWILGNKGYDIMNSAANVENQIASFKPVVSKGGLISSIKGAYGKGVDIGEMAGVNSMQAVGRYGRDIYSAISGSWIDRAASAVSGAIGFTDKYQNSLLSNQNLGDMRTGLSVAAGLQTRGDVAAGMKALFAGGGSRGVKSANMVSGIDLSKLSIDEQNTLGTMMSTASFTGNTDNLKNSKEIRRYMDKANALGALNKHSGADIAYTVVSQIAQNRTQVDQDYHVSLGKYNKFVEQSMKESGNSGVNLQDLRFYKSTGTKMPENTPKAAIDFIEAEKKYNDQNKYSPIRVSKDVSERDVKESAKLVRDVMWNPGKKSVMFATGTIGSGWNKDVTNAARVIYPNFDPNKTEDIEGLYRAYKDKRSKGAVEDPIMAKAMGTLTTKVFDKQWIKPYEESIANKDKSAALDYVDARVSGLSSIASKMNVALPKDFQSKLTGILTGETKNAKQYIADVAGTLEELGVTGDRHYQLRKGEDQAAWASRVLNNEGAVGSLMQSSANAKAIKELKGIIIGSEKGDTGGEIMDPTDPKGIRKIKVANSDRALQLMAALKDDVAPSVSATSGDRGNSRYTNINPPITNYWNNRWAM